MRPSPSERAWIHPSELPSTAALAQFGSPRGPRRWLQALLGTSAVVLLSAGLTLLVTSTPVMTAAPAVHTTRGLAGLPPTTAKLARSLVALSITYDGQTSEAGGVVVSPTTIATTASIPQSSRIVARIGSTTTDDATVIGQDAAIGLTVLSIPSSAPRTPMAHQLGNSAATAVSVERSASGTAVVEWSPATVGPPTVAVEVDDNAVGAIQAPSALDAVAGSALASQDGALLGIADPALGHHTYLPSAVVAAVSERVAKDRSDAHGWLQITGRTAHGGAEVVSVARTSPANGSIGPGDVIVKVGNTDVHSIGQLIDFLWTVPGRTLVTLHLVHHGAHRTVTVALASSP